jgi:hypothetical protein
VDHLAIRWVDAAEATSLNWVDADRAVLADLLRLLDGT